MTFSELLLDHLLGHLKGVSSLLYYLSCTQMTKSGYRNRHIIQFADDSEIVSFMSE